jgi:hypothetical protein
VRAVFQLNLMNIKSQKTSLKLTGFRECLFHFRELPDGGQVYQNPIPNPPKPP